MSVRVIERLPVPGSGCGDLRLIYEGLDLRVEYEYRVSKRDWIGALSFHHVAAFKFVDEMHSVGFLPGSYDALVEVEASAWLADLEAREPPGISGVRGKKHYAVFFSSNGYLEAVAERYSVGTPFEGRMERPDRE